MRNPVVATECYNLVASKCYNVLLFDVETATGLSEDLIDSFYAAGDTAMVKYQGGCFPVLILKVINRSVAVVVPPTNAAVPLPPLSTRKNSRHKRKKKVEAEVEVEVEYDGNPTANIDFIIRFVDVDGGVIQVPHSQLVLTDTPK